MKESAYFGIAILALLLSNKVSFCQDSTSINIYMSDGFIPYEEVLLIVENEMGVQDTLYHGKLMRSGLLDVNSFEKKIAKDTVYSIILRCESRAVQTSIVVKLKDEFYLDFSINLRNVFQILISDTAILFD